METQSAGLNDVQELHIEDEEGAGRDDGPHPLLSIGEVRGDDQGPPLPHTHPSQACVPPSYHLWRTTVNLDQYYFVKPVSRKLHSVVTF